MSKIEKSRVCPKCGARLQYFDPFSPGFITKENYINHLNDHRVMLCDKCYHEHRQDEENEYLTLKNNELYAFLRKLKGKGTFIYVIDYVSFLSLFDDNISAILKDEKTIVVINRINRIIPKLDVSYVRDFVTKAFVSHGIDPLTVLFINDPKAEHEDIKAALVDFVDMNQDVYVIGPKFSGKTVAIKSFLKNYSNHSDSPVVLDTKKLPFITSKIPITKKSAIQEIEGFSNGKSLLEKVTYKLRQEMIAKSLITPISVSIHDRISLLFGGLAEINFIKAPKTRTTLITYANQYFVRKHIENNRFTNGLKAHKFIPTFNNSDASGATETITISLVKDVDFSLEISGLGFVILPKGSYVIAITLPDGVGITTSDRILIYAK
ncbi:MAG: hypothetical protein LBR37_03945 [Erysipelotrichaceae bacterium]|jgi:hypothetical protein|nr:hypothetical protein [Erysipelotrichaceae bacterium]